MVRSVGKPLIVSGFCFVGVVWDRLVSFEPFVSSHLAIAPVCNTKKLPVNKPEQLLTLTTINSKCSGISFCMGRGDSHLLILS